MSLHGTTAGLATELRIHLTEYIEFLPGCWAALDACASAHGRDPLPVVVVFAQEGSIGGRWEQWTTALQIRESMPLLQAAGKLKFVWERRFPGILHTRTDEYIVESEEEASKRQESDGK